MRSFLSKSDTAVNASARTRGRKPMLVPGVPRNGGLEPEKDLARRSAATDTQARGANREPHVRMKFIHAADIHLDSPLIGLQRYDGAPVEALRGATRRAFQALVDLALAEPVDFLLIAGDLYDGDWRDFNTGLFFVQQATRLTRAGIPIFLIHGNHDAESRISRRLTLPETGKMFSAARPETARRPELGVAIHGQSFRPPDVTDTLARDYPAPIPGWFNIGLLHTAATGREGHAPYAPCDPRD